MLNIVKNTTLPSPLDLIAPHYCRGCGRVGSILCIRCKKNIINNYQNYCPFCKYPSSSCICTEHCNFPPAYIIAKRGSLISSLARDLKYNSVRSAARPLAEILNAVLPTFHNTLIIVPLPTISPHIRKRGLDHTLLISKHLSKMRKNTKVSRLLLRTNKTTQVGSNRKQRLSQAKNAYSINPAITIKKDVTYLLLDDVWTTGASIKAATKILQSHKIDNIAITILSLS